jgi:hypothetical protein
MSTQFDPFYYEEEEQNESKITTKLTVTTAGKVILSNAEVAKNSIPKGYWVQIVPEDCDLYVYADVVLIFGTLKQRESAVQINARVIETAANGATQASIDVSGKPGLAPDPALPKAGQAKSDTEEGSYDHNYWPGKACDSTPPGKGTSGQPGKDGDQGENGGNAGWVYLYCRIFKGDTLTLNARGGRGGDGQDGQPGQDGGNGGKGADAFYHQTTKDPAQDGGNAGRGGLGGRAGPGGGGGNGGTVAVACLSSTISTNITAVTKAGATGNPGKAGAPGKDGSPGEGGNAVIDHTWGMDRVIIPKGNVGGFEPPIPQPALTPILPTPPKDGLYRSVPGSPYSTIATTVSEDQLVMLLESARINVLKVDKSNTQAQTYQDLVDQLTWLIGICDAWSKKTINVAASGILRNLKDPLVDAFGNSPDWVPMISLQTCDAQLGDATKGSLCVLETAEQQWQAYSDLRKNNSEVLSQITSAINSYKNRVTDLEEQRDRCLQAVADLSDRITVMADEITNYKKAAQTVLKGVDKLISDKLNLDPMKYIDVIEQSAFAMFDIRTAATVYGAEQVKFWKSAVTDIKGDDTQIYNKDYLIERIDTLNDDLGNLDESYTIYNNGYIQTNDPGGYKLLASQTAIKNLLDVFKKTLPGVKDAEKAIKTYVDSVLKRNAIVLEYNAALANFVQLKTQIDQLSQQEGQLDSEAAGIPLRVGDQFLLSLYQRAKQNVITELYEASRAYRFWSLNDMDVFKISDFSNITYATAIDKKQAILAKRIADINSLADTLQQRNDPAVVTFTIKDHPEILDAFMKDRGKNNQGVPQMPFWEFTLEPPTADSTSDDNPFMDMTNVRLDEVRCWLIGLTSTDSSGNVKVHLTQQGDEKITPSSGGDPVSMRHVPVPALFEYSTKKTWPSDGAVVTATEYWKPLVTGQLPTCTPIGPFATWRIALRAADFTDSKIAWDSLTEIQLEFYVRFHVNDTVV